MSQRLRDAVLSFDPQLPVERAATPPALWYRDPELYALEQGAVLRRSWHAVGRSDALAEPGAYVSGELLGEPYLIARDPAGSLRAFYNVCRHHAARLLEGSGRCERIVCPYHGWTYGLGGRLERAPGMGEALHVDRASLDLVPIAVAEHGPLLLLCLHPHPPELAECFGGLPPELAPAALQGLRFAAERRYTIRCNWKVAVENYLDGGYHVPVLHRDLAAGLDLDTYRTSVAGPVVVQSVASLGGDQRIGERATYAWVHPALMLNRYGPVLDTNRIVPRGPEETEVVFEFFLEPQAAADPGFVERALAASDAIQREDSAICEAVQQGLRSASFGRGRYAPRFEHGAHHFHCMLARELRRALELT